MYGYIYKTTNLINGKIYIGQKRASVFLDNDYLGSGRYFKNAVNKYGQDNFKVEIIESCESEKELNEREIYWISHYRKIASDMMYNISDGGNGGDTFSGRSDIEKQKTREKLSKNSSDRVRIKRDNKFKFVKISELEKYLKNGWIRGSQPLTEESRKKQSESLKSLVWITNGDDNRRIKNTSNLSNYPNYYYGFTHHTKSKEERRRAFLKRREEKKKEYFKTKHYCEKCGKLITEYIGDGRFCSKSCASTHKHTEETKQKIGELSRRGVCGMKNKHLSNSQKIKHSIATKKYYEKHKTIWINKNDEIEKRVDEISLQYYLEQGWIRGRLKNRQIPWNKGLTIKDERVKNNIQKRNTTMLKKYNTLNTYEIKKLKESEEVFK